MPSNKSFEKASAKLLGSFGSGVTIAQPSGGERMDSRERELMRERLEKESAVVETRTQEGEGSATPAPAPVVEPVAEAEVKVVEESSEKQKGRPRKIDPDANLVLMNFRVEDEYRQRIKMLAVERHVSILELFKEAFDDLLSKYGR